MLHSMVQDMSDFSSEICYSNRMGISSTGDIFNFVNNKWTMYDKIIQTVDPGLIGLIQSSLRLLKADSNPDPDSSRASINRSKLKVCDQ